MSNIPDELKYTKEHEWVRSEDDGTVTVGITHYAQESLGDITYVELPEEGATFGAGDVFGVVESVKAASDLYCPVAGEVVAINGELDASPEMVNAEPYGGGWMIRVKTEDDASDADLLSAAEYQDII